MDTGWEGQTGGGWAADPSLRLRHCWGAHEAGVPNARASVGR